MTTKPNKALREVLCAEDRRAYKSWLGRYRRATGERAKENAARVLSGIRRRNPACFKGKHRAGKAHKKP